LAFKHTYYVIESNVHNKYMGAEEKKEATDAWDKHVEGINHKHKFMSFSSEAEAVFCEAFRRDVRAHGKLTEKEKLEILTYMKG